MLAFASVIGSEDRFRAHALPGLQRVAEPDTVIAEYRDAPSTAAAYNEVLDALWGRDDLEGLVLVPEDAEILDPGFCARLRRRLAEPGVAVIDAGPLLVLSPWAVRELRFGDGDIRERARAAGARVVTEPVDVVRPNPPSAPCPVCHARVAGAPGPAGRDVVACAQCGAGVTVPAPSREADSDGIFEEQYGGRRLALRDHWFAEAAVRLSWVTRHVSTGTLVDVGCATGEFAATAARAGFRAFGVEPSPWAAEQARGLELEAVLSDLAQWDAGRADAATLWHVLEHLHEPRELLGQIRSVLRPGASLFVEVPHFGADDAREDPIAWVGPALDDHVTHFTAPTLRRVLTDAGYTVVEERPLPSMLYDPAERFAQRCARWRALGREAPSEDLLRMRAVA